MLRRFWPPSSHKQLERSVNGGSVRVDGDLMYFDATVVVNAPPAASVSLSLFEPTGSTHIAGRPQQPSKSQLYSWFFRFGFLPLNSVEAF